MHSLHMRAAFKNKGHNLRITIFSPFQKGDSQPLTQQLKEKSSLKKTPLEMQVTLYINEGTTVVRHNKHGLMWSQHCRYLSGKLNKYLFIGYKLNPHRILERFKRMHRNVDVCHMVEEHPSSKSPRMVLEL